jgi:hypothetical protein
MLPSQQPHPSPPTVVAISSSSNILLSASPAPPTIYIQDRRWGGSAPVNFQPSDAQTPVTCAAFQRTQDSDGAYTHFVLGFQDGRVVLYRLRVPKQRGHYFQLQPVKVGAIGKLHKATMRGVAAVEFVPSYFSRIVSVGHDGRCRLVDFEGGGKVLRTWYVDGEATCLSVCPGTRGDGMDGQEMLIAVGTNAEKIEVFNVLGLLVGEIDMDGPVIGLEWVGDMCGPLLLPSRISSASPVSSLKGTKSLLIEGEKEGIVKQKTSRNVHPTPLPIGRDLFSQDKDSNTPRRKRSSAPARQALARIRPRISTETFKAPPPALSSIMRQSSSSSSPSASSQSDQEFFTPPSTQRRRRDKTQSKGRPKAKVPYTSPPPPATPRRRTSSATKAATRRTIGNADGAGSVKSPSSLPLRQGCMRRTSTPSWLIPRPTSVTSEGCGYRASKQRVDSDSDSDSTDCSTCSFDGRPERYVDGSSTRTRTPRHSASVDISTLFVQQAKLRRDVAGLRRELEDIKQDLSKCNSSKAERSGRQEK